MSSTADGHWLEALDWGADGLVPAIAQDHKTGQVLMVAWMNREALTTYRRIGSCRLLVAFS